MLWSKSNENSFFNLREDIIATEIRYETNSANSADNMSKMRVVGVSMQQPIPVLRVK